MLKKRVESKKALSTIVSTLLILLLVFVAVAVLWSVVRSVLQQGTEQVSLGKFTLNLKIDSVVINPADNSVSIKVVRNPGSGNFTGLRFIFKSVDNTETMDSNISLKEYERKSFSFTLKVIKASDVQTIEVAPLFTLSSGKISPGDIQDTYEVQASSISTPQCTDTCSSLGYTCGNQTVCGALTSCGTCSTGTCNSTGQCA